MSRHRLLLYGLLCFVLALVTPVLTAAFIIYVIGEFPGFAGLSFLPFFLFTGYGIGLISRWWKG